MTLDQKTVECWCHGAAVWTFDGCKVCHTVSEWVKATEGLEACRAFVEMVAGLTDAELTKRFPASTIGAQADLRDVAKAVLAGSRLIR